jgi:hypothetical protein
MNAAALQNSLFKQVKDRLPAHLSLADEIAGLLGLSPDSAYRRIRGEKLMDLDELLKVCGHYKISIDPLLGQADGSFLFHGDFVGSKDLQLPDWLIGMSSQLERIASIKDLTFIFRAEDIPTFHFFQIPELTRFKLFFWRRTIINDPAYQTKRFDLQEKEEELVALARKVYLSYKRLPSIEIWNADSLNAFLRQITFYRDAGMFVKEEDVDVLFEKLGVLLDHLQMQVETGVKFLLGEPGATGGASFKVYVNEVMQGDNMIYAEGNGMRTVFVNHSAINYVSTMDEVFCDRTRNSIENVMRRSVLISGTGEKERNRYFNALRTEVGRRRLLLV